MTIEASDSVSKDEWQDEIIKAVKRTRKRLFSSAFVAEILAQRCYLGAAQTRCKALRVCLHGLLCKWRCYLQKTPCSLLTGALMCIGNLLSVLMMLSRCNNSSADSILFIFMQDGGPLEWLHSQFVSQTYIWSLHWMLYYFKVPFNEELEWEASI